ncbi:AMP-binding protein [Nonomuraea sp. NBC_01738]|uniref:class I adenylate-forming enzyme family protein n=1 Tax=Nonomuraea sp. NBC_01738 TaxID=2976003 RepID=UPI002E0F8375|nr:AMP-binding protein [Nonomuraea sp. NBC_01738]
MHVLEWRAAVTPDAVALSDQRGGSLTYAGLVAAVERRAGGFTAAGVAPGEVVPLLAHNSVDWVVALFGLVRAGALPAPLNWRLSPPELAALVALTGARRVVADDACAPSLTTAVLPLAGEPYGEAPERPVERLRGPEPCLLLHTSGTTGRAKLVPISHEMLVAAILFMKLEVPEAAPGARHLSALPLFHAAGVANLAYSLLTGGNLHVMSAFTPATFVDELIGRRIQLTQLVPTLINAVEAEVRAREVTLPDLVEVVYGASPIHPDALARAVRTLGCRFRQNYASTETGPLPITTLGPADHDPARGRLASAGRPSLGWEVRLGEFGEIQVRGAISFPGYWGDEAATGAALTPDGFYRTGDIGAFDADGYLTIVDRLKDMIVTGGENVYAAEVEAILSRAPGVREVAVFGVPHETWGESVHAVVAGEGSAEDLVAWAKVRLAGYKCPTAITFVDALPRNATGKVLKEPLREPYWTGRARRVS